ncbi:MAG: hypothetical protein RTV31_05150 [Candidatus Thorarchaeota archaeon]
MVSETVQIIEQFPIETSTRTSLYESALLLLGSYMIAALLTTAIHELGHGMALASISVDFQLMLNPFSTSMTMPLLPIPSDSLAWVAAAGTIVELVFGTAVFAIFWRWRSSKLLPLLMAAPLSYLTSAGYFLLGSSIVDGDTALMITMGIPELLIQGLGAVMLVLGVVFLILMFPLLGMSRNDSFKRIFLILFLGMTLHGFGMIVFALVANPYELYIGIANVVSMMFTITILAGVFVRKGHFFDQLSHSEVAILDRTTVLLVSGVALVLIILELLFLN